MIEGAWGSGSKAPKCRGDAAKLFLPLSCALVVDNPLRLSVKRLDSEVVVIFSAEGLYESACVRVDM